MSVQSVKHPQISKAKVTAARNQNSIGDRNGENPWEKPGSVKFIYVLNKMILPVVDEYQW